MYFSMGQGGRDLSCALALHEAEEAKERARELAAMRPGGKGKAAPIQGAAENHIPRHAFV